MFFCEKVQVVDGEQLDDAGVLSAVVKQLMGCMPEINVLIQTSYVAMEMLATDVVNAVAKDTEKALGYSKNEMKVWLVDCCQTWSEVLCNIAKTTEVS